MTSIPFSAPHLTNRIARFTQKSGLGLIRLLSARIGLSTWWEPKPSPAGPGWTTMTSKYVEASNPVENPNMVSSADEKADSSAEESPLHFQVGRIEMVMGPMFSGKTSELLRRLKRYEAVGTRTVLFNHVFDEERYLRLPDAEFSREGGTVTSHDGHQRSAYSVSYLKPFLKGYRDSYHSEVSQFVRDRLQEADVIAIDEGQFFPDLKEAVVSFAEEENKHVIVCGLDGNFKREKFGEALTPTTGIYRV